MISYYTEGVKMPDIKRRLTTSWVRRIAALYGKKVGDVAYIFCNDEKILKVNREYLNHDYYTDIITFDYSEADVISGDIFISVNTVLSNSHDQQVSYDEELRRVIIHGILHLCGINDKGPGERQVMEKEEDKALSLWEEL
ncbi:MAG: rRNA maturation RNase YbeY [Prevotella sp.]|nr:rRNA maturation RNase YbeY [Candidatus Equicola faecalis]